MRKTETIYYNGNIVTMDESQPMAEAVLVQEGRIISVGCNQEILHQMTQNTETIDLDGMTMLPGFSDNHLHLLGYGISLMEVDLFGLTSIEQVIQRISEKAATTEKGKWILGRGWDQNLYREGRYFNRHDLDQAAPHNPVAVSRICGHAVVLNSLALTLAKIDVNTEDPIGGRVDRDPETGEPNGIVREEAIRLIKHIIPPYSNADLKSALRLASLKAVSTGITSVTTDDVSAAGGVAKCLDLYRSLWDGEGGGIRANLLIAESFLHELYSLGMRTGSGDHQVRIGPAKMFQDGSLGARTAAMLEPYSDSPDEKGLLIHSQEDLDHKVNAAHQAGMQIGIHAIGDAAIESVLLAYKKAQTLDQRPDPRHRVIHYEVVNPQILEISKELGIIADIQPKFLTTDGSWLESRLGPDRMRNACAWATIINKGIIAVGGSDCPVEPLDPILGIHAAVTRKVYDSPDPSWVPEERISVTEAIKMFTSNGAFSSFEENIRGRIIPGLLADFVVLDRDPWKIMPEDLANMQVVYTIIGGEVVYKK
jgi:hypothetical protein